MGGKVLLVIGVGLTALGACSSVRITDAWKSSEAEPTYPYKSILISTLLADRMNVRIMEDALEDRLKQHRVSCIKGYDQFPQMYSDTSMPEKEGLYCDLNDKGKLAVLTVSILRIDTAIQSHGGGKAAHSPYPQYEWYDNFWGYYSYYHPRIYERGYYTYNNSFFIEANLYDLSTDKLVWSVQTETYKLNDITDFSEDFAQTITRYMVRKGLIERRRLRDYLPQKSKKTPLEKESSF